MITITKKQLTAVLIAEVLLIICKFIDSYYTRAIIDHGSLGMLDWLYMYLVFPLENLFGAGLLSSTAFLALRATNNTQRLLYRIVSITIVSILSLAIAYFAFELNVNSLISVPLVLGVIISGVVF